MHWHGRKVFDRRVIATVLVGIAVMFGRETLLSQLGLWGQAGGLAIVLLLIAATLIAATKYYPRVTLFEFRRQICARAFAPAVGARWRHRSRSRIDPCNMADNAAGRIGGRSCCSPRRGVPLLW